MNIEKWAVRKLYLADFAKHARINKKKKSIIFGEFDWILFKHFHSFKEWLYFGILTQFYGYKVYEKRLCLFVPQKKEITQTWGEIQDIIRAYHYVKNPHLYQIKPTSKSLSR